MHIKRIFDFSVALLGLIINIPLFLVVGILIKANDKGPVFFRQKRVGKDGKLFNLIKFRSMASKPLTEEGTFEPGNVSRVTTIGRFLRKTKIDELPQLINVLKGEMSIVGPRPEIRKWVDLYPDRWGKVLTIRPGITDNSAILFRNEEELLARSEDPEKMYKEIILPSKLEMYEEYVDTNSFFGDLKLIFSTLISLSLK